MARKLPRWARRMINRGGSSVDSRFALTRWFAVCGALAIGLFSLSMAALLSGFLATRMLERDAAISRDFLQSIISIQRVAGFLRQPHAQPEASVTEFFAHVAIMPDVLRANVYSLDRRVLWSSNQALIGQTFAANDELERALRGQVVVNREEAEGEAGKEEHLGMRPHAYQFVENYLPIYDDQKHELIGVVELYRQPTALFTAIASGQRLVWWSSAAGGVFLLFVLLWFVRRTELALQAQQRRLVDAETLAIVGEISAAVAHSIRNPLVSIRTSAELQSELLGDDDGVQRDIMRNADRIEHLVRTLLTYAADPSDRQGSADVATVLRDATERFATELTSHGMHLALDLAPELGSVAADPLLLAQVFNSLLANAIEATERGDRVSVGAKRVGLWTQIEVADSGSGMQPDQLKQIFKPFYTTKPRGLGMGLPLARRLVERLGGQLAIDSQLGQGTRVRLRLPLVGGSA
jgi:signal transduction histidine kinase